MQRRRLFYGLFFVSPWIIGFLWFTLYPMGASLYYSFTDYNLIKTPQWIGAANFRELLGDELFWTSLYNTFYLTVVGLPVTTIFSVGLAVLLNQKIRGLAFYRTIYYVPSVVPIVATSIVWMWLLNPAYGPINTFLGWLGISGPNWLRDMVWAKPALILTGLWGVGPSVIIYLAALQEVPQQLLEAAELDGAGAWQKLFRITLPMISPAVFFNVIMGVIGSFQIFAQPLIMTNGGPANATLVYALYLFRNAFSYFKMGYASALAWVLFGIILLCTVLIFKTSARWVYYETGGNR
ncbi:MAG: sugar ABC transporter permease [Firmicutes bacterium]|nr:sugar ABC transporter permease [Bacillota bacterium]